MEWNPTSLTPATAQPILPANNLPVHPTHPQQHHYQFHQQYAQQPQPIIMSSGLASGVVSRGGLGIGIEKEDDSDDRRPSTPRNLSPAVLVTDYGDDSLVDENHDDLLVFGYGCKIFRDDERAQWVEDQKHLIPWMSNRDLLIDRYDCRGALMDISRYEPGSSYDNSQESLEEDDSVDLNSTLEQEQLLEQELDEERYKELNEDVDYDEGAYDKAGDYKRLQTAMNGMLTESQEGPKNDTGNYAAFQYNYDEKNHDICIGPEPKRVQSEDDPYEKPVGLYIPEEIKLPATMKIHAIIVKTAKFIASQGNQMEIILKTKQSSNPLFDFLNHGGNLNAYYKFLVHAIRSGIYRPPVTAEQDDDASNTQKTSQSMSSEYSGSEEDSEHHTYLHPSLFRTSNMNSNSALSSIDYTPATVGGSGTSSSTRHNTYSMLVSKIKGTESPDPLSQQQQPSPTAQTPSYIPEYPPSQNSSNHQNMYSVFGYKLSSQPTSGSSTPPKPQKKLPSTPDQLIIEKMASYVIKNGANFEVLAKNKSDARFGFLNSSHEYHWYYLNCKERFKAECTAVVASSDFVNYSNNGNALTSAGASLNSTLTKPALPSTNTVTGGTIKKSAVAAELAELKRKNSGLSGKKEASKEKTSLVGGSVGGSGTAETVFSQANLVQNKEKDKPVIRFSSSLGLNSISLPSTTGGVPAEKLETKTSFLPTELPCPSHEMAMTQKRGVSSSGPEDALSKIPKESASANATTVSVSSAANTNVTTAVVTAVQDDDEEEGEIRDGDDDSDSDIYLLDDEPGGTNSSPASEDDEEKRRRRLERKRKAALFLQKLKMAKVGSGSNARHSTIAPSSLLTATTPAVRESPNAQILPCKKPVTSGTSLGDLLNRRLQSTVEASAAQQERINSTVPPEITLSDSDDDARAGGRSVVDNDQDSSRSSGSVRHTDRKKRNHATSSSSRTSRKKKRRRRSRSYSSSHSPSRSPSSSTSSYGSGSHSRKKSSKKKRKKKKKKYDKSSRSSHKSKRR